LVSKPADGPVSAVSSFDANLCSDTINEVAEVAQDGLDRFGSDVSPCFAFLRHCGLRL